MFIVQYEKGPQSFCDTLEEARKIIGDRKWLRIYEIETSNGKILQNIYPAGTTEK